MSSKQFVYLLLSVNALVLVTVLLLLSSVIGPLALLDLIGGACMVAAAWLMNGRIPNRTGPSATPGPLTAQPHYATTAQTSAYPPPPSWPQRPPTA